MPGRHCQLHLYSHSASKQGHALGACGVRQLWRMSSISSRRAVSQIGTMATSKTEVPRILKGWLLWCRLPLTRHPRFCVWGFQVSDWFRWFVACVYKFNELFDFRSVTTSSFLRNLSTVDVHLVQMYGKAPVVVMPNDAAGREIHPLFFHASVCGYPLFSRMPILSLLQWAL